MTTSPDTRESHFRSVLKAITYRIIGSLTTYAVTRDFGASLAITAFEPLVKTIVYYLHERAWQQMPRGNVRRLFRAR